jgi:hypothetical protein
MQVQATSERMLHPVQLLAKFLERRASQDQYRLLTPALTQTNGFNTEFYAVRRLPAFTAAPAPGSEDLHFIAKRSETNNNKA